MSSLYSDNKLFPHAQLEPEVALGAVAGTGTGTGTEAWAEAWAEAEAGAV